MKSKLRIIVFGFYAASWLMVFALWLQINYSQLASFEGFVLAAARLLGLSAAFMVTIQIFLVSRLPILEKNLGLDKLTRLHSAHGKYGFLFILSHPLLIVFSGALVSKEGFLKLAWLIINSHVYFLYALVSLLLFSVVVGFSYGIIRGRLKYENWYLLHLVVYLAIGFSFWHQFKFGHTLNSSTILYIFLASLYAISILSILIYRWILPIVRSWKHKFYVDKVVIETSDVTSIYIRGERLDELRAMPGQFVFVRFLSEITGYESHPFSLSLVANDYLRLTIKNLGDFTSNVSKLQIGTRMIIEGPYGVFGQDIVEKKKILFISGGIGITPIRSLLQKVVKYELNAVLIYGSRTEREIVFEEELKNFSTENVKIFHVISDNNLYTGETGRIDEEKIKRFVPDLKERDVYICGPGVMLKSILKVLNNMDVKADKIHYEKFSLT